MRSESPMNETVYSADAALRQPGRFFREALEDLRRAPAVGWRLFRSNVQARHRRSWLGYLWLVLPAVGTTLVWTYVQSRRIVAIAPTGLPYPVYVLTGMVLWQVFVDALNAPLQQLVAGRQVISRSRVPHEAFLFAGLIETLFNCAVRTAVLVPVLVFFDIRVSAMAMMIPIGVAALTLFGLALGTAIAPAGMLYDDVGRAVTLVTGLWFFATPILYPARGAMRWNPLTGLVETTRGWLTGPAGDGGFLSVVALSVPVLVAAWLLLRLSRPHVVARLG